MDISRLSRTHPTQRPAVTPKAAPAGAPASGLGADTWLANQPAATMASGLERIQALADRLNAAGDRRAVFASTYIIQLKAFAADVQKPGSYENPVWMEKMVLDFLQRYLDAFDAYERKDFAKVPAPWKTAFDRAVAGDGPVMGDLLLAMNAHINHDLPLTLAATKATPEVKADYLRFNDVLEANIDAVQALIADKYLKPGSLAAKGDKWLSKGDEALTNSTIRRWRDAAWSHGERALANGEAAYPAILQRAGWRSRVIATGVDLVPNFLAKRGLL